MSTEHTSSRFESELNDIHSRFLRMGGIVESMIADSVEIISSGNAAMIETVLDQEREVNRLEIDIDNAIVSLLALRQPKAVDLRMLMAVSKMLTDMERSGDEAEKIVKTARRLHENHMHFDPTIDLHYLATSVGTMLRKVLDAFARRDPIAAAEVVRSDKLVDKEWKSNLRELISYMIEDPRTISSSIDLLFMARSFERIGDHCKNMAERVIFMVQGADVRHTKVKKVEKVARGEIEV